MMGAPPALAAGRINQEERPSGKQKPPHNGEGPTHRRVQPGSHPWQFDFPALALR